MKDRIKDLARLLDVPTWLVKESLGMPLEECPANSVEEAKLDYIYADKESEEERAALKKLNAFLLKIITTANIEKIQEVYSLAREFGIYEIEVAALYKWNELARECVDKAKTDEELKMAYEKTPKNSSSRRAALEKKSRWALKSLEEARTLDEYVRACKRAPKDSDTKRYIIKYIYDSFFKK
jgi:MoaA/NifB/PqqE/SkfB family radical SAM enzyme